MKGIPRRSRRFFLLCAFAAAGVNAWGQDQAFPRLEADPVALSFAAAHQAGGGNAELYLGMALWASGVPDGRAGDAEKRLRAAIAELATQELPASEGARAEAILTFMHSRFLRRYEERQTRLDLLVLSGSYNCVSSAVLYLILGTAAGLDVEGVVTRDHALCTVRTEAGRVDVETTSSLGFDPGTRREFQDEFGRVTGFSYVPPRNYRDRSPVGPLELVSLIFSNRIVEAEAAGRYSQAVEMALDRASLLSLRNRAHEAPLFGDPRKELIDRLLNFAAALARSGRDEQALDWAAAVSVRFGADPRWADFVHAALNNLIVRHLRAGRTPEARAALDARSYLLDERSHLELERLVTDAELIELTRTLPRGGNPEGAYQAVAAAEARGALAPARAVELRSFIALGEAERAASVAGYRGGLESIEIAISRFGPYQRLEEARRVYRANRVAELHNRFARLFNRRNYAEARDAALEALGEFPGERRFLENRDMAERSLKSGSN